MYLRSVLPNGLRIIGESMPYVHSVTIGLWVRVGSRDEQAGYEGVSHFIEHMLFKGTKQRSAKEIAEAIDAVGGQLNAFTTREYTCFYAKVLDNHISLALDLLADMYCASILDPEEIAKEKGVIYEEIKSYEDTPDELVHDLLASASWPEHPLGKSILGTPQSVGGLSREQIKTFMDRYYRAENTVLALAGRIDYREIQDLAEHRLSGLAPGTCSHGQETPISAGTRQIKIKDTEQVHLCLGGHGVARGNRDKYAIHVLDSILGGSVSSRLFQKLREERGLVYATGSTHSAFCDTGLFSIYAGTAPENVGEVMRLIGNELENLISETVPEQELARAKEQLRGNMLLTLESGSARMSRLAKTELFGDEILSPEEIITHIESVTANDIMRVARVIFDPGSSPAAAIIPPYFSSEMNALFER